MEILISNGAHLNYCNTDDSEVPDKLKTMGYLTHEPLNMAIENNYVDCVRLLLENGAKPNHKYFMGYEVNLVPLDNLECMELLLQYNANPNVFNRCGLSPLMKASRENKPEAVKLLLKYGADLNVESPPRFEQKTALHYAIRGGNFEIVKMLVENGARLSRPENYKFSPLHEAILSDRVDICDLLLKHNCNIEEETDNYTTPLMLVCGTPGLKCCRGLVKLLLENQADVNAHSKYVSYTDPYLSPLSEYLKNYEKDPDYDIISLLVKYGAKVSLRGYLSVVRLKDPFGVLQYWKPLSNRPDIKNLLVEAASSFDLPSIMDASSATLCPSDKERLMFYGSRPRELKHLIRQFLRQTFAKNMLQGVQSLPLPVCLKSYLLFE
ncbi:hypothetical protein FSP39_006803 [Pinctada imbricata]|uniref:SOCS box domain-containing protein n=1 Tax=Pinctada imbricata TaxID=66713 RepID=A0AA88XS06_PINIB|nr:hypothetical protein FSP39_006803 [Pinctada imbricata]